MRGDGRSCSTGTSTCGSGSRAARRSCGRCRSAAEDHRGAVAEQALVGGDADPGTLDLAAGGLAAKLPGDLADLGQRLGRDSLAEAGQSARRVDRDPATEGGLPGTQQRLGLAPLAELEVL